MAQSSQTAQEQEEEAVYRAMEGYYLNGRPPWDTGVTPPELVALVEEHDGPPGRVLELGCGTGTNAVYLARHGWDVTAVDLIDRAVEQAREKAEAEACRYGCSKETPPAWTTWACPARSTCSST